MKYALIALLLLTAVCANAQLKVRVHALQLGAPPPTPDPDPEPSTDTVAKFNFLGSAGYAVAGWTSYYGAPNNSIITASDSRSGTAIGISSVATGYANWGAPSTAVSNSGGATVDDGGGFIFPAAVLVSRWYVSSTYRNTANPNLRFSGLNPAKTYTFHFCASRTAGSVSTAKQTAEFRLVTTTQDLTASVDGKGNTSKLAILTGIIPKSDGTVDCYFNHADSDFANVNGLVIIAE